MTRSYPERPFVGVGALVFRGEEVLLVKRGTPPRLGQWSIPGGIQQLGESVAEAALREVREEAGIAVEIKEVIAVVDAITRDAEGRVRYHYTLIDVLAEWQAGEAVAGDDAAAVAWVPLDGLETYGLWQETLRVIGLAAARRTRQGGAAPAIAAPGIAILP
ncbi:MAG: NUDIX hydrolase [Alphaproteobacteria bacterium]